ncbi:PilW family protein [Nevskia sp.]|nr:prepilin-type N-terminal cleavage/methylation domain-containing protein [Nevskia sp.]
MTCVLNRRQRGFSLIELMVAIALGLFLMLVMTRLMAQ